MKLVKPGHGLHRLRAILGTAFVAVVGLSAGAPAATLTTLYSFNGSDGANPAAGLIADASGNLYGTTSNGGASCEFCGTVFELVLSGGGTYTESVLYSFTGANDGNDPIAGLIIDASGNLYGTTTFGGSSGIGTVFKLAPATETETVLHNFAGGSDGAYPSAGLIADASGDLYGTTHSGGTGGHGTVFKLTPTGAATVLYSFTGGTDGANPEAGLIMDALGNLYGTTYGGGTKGNGIVFRLSPTTATETVLYSFTGGTDGGKPAAGLIADASGNLYGTTVYGGRGHGTVFKLAPSGGGTYSESVLYSFTGRSDGTNPVAGLIIDASGNLYGTTLRGGADNFGTVFKLTPTTGTETVLHSFDGGSDGAHPAAGLIADASGDLYGTTVGGGNSAVCPVDGGCGTVFKLAGGGFVPPFAGTPEAANCIGKSISSLTRTYGGIAEAAVALGYANVTDLQNAVASYCRE